MARDMLLTVMLGPLLLIQGQWVRRRTPRLPEPDGARQGRCGTGPWLRILVLGDSAAAGVGAANQSEALLGQVVGALSGEFRLDWSLVARTGATTAETIETVRQMPSGVFDVVITSLGVNDATRGVQPARWSLQQGELRRLLRERFSARLIVCSGLPPVHSFPALPQPLRWYLGRRATRFDQILRGDTRGEANAEFLSLRFSDDRALMATDGFHPGPGIYREWGRRVAELVRENFNVEGG
ncbi:SGNH/GDSL hydrolase family protein [Microbulbifer guangxiensis]|uniref:SGNH/GDSL hydrolase family protein n=1 Tax=Microbulbifer guangxiensis TaxID=2904249 RepID=UPI001F209FB0|nr:SGNH/GDSL hydrolase family protein [Microbulbifer guangxiensis]